MQVSVIIINYNTFRLTCEAIASIQAQTHGVSYEIVLVDNASTECDAELFVKKFGDGITLVRNPDNSGFAKGNNLGIKHSTGDTILLFNSDAACRNDALTITYQALLADPRLGVTTARLEYPDGRIQAQCGRFPSVRLQIIELLRLQKLLPAAQAGRILMGGFFDHLSDLEPDWVWGAYFHFRREVLAGLPGGQLPDDFFMYAEDLEWSHAIRRLGYGIRYVAAARVLHHFSQSTKQEKQLNQTSMVMANEADFLRRTYGPLHTRIYHLTRWLLLHTTGPSGSAGQHLRAQYVRLLRGQPLL